MLSGSSRPKCFVSGAELFSKNPCQEAVLYCSIVREREGEKIMVFGTHILKGALHSEIKLGIRRKEAKKELILPRPGFELEDPGQLNV